MSEPDILEPVACAFDGDGRMFIAEMRTYMQEIDGPGRAHPHEPCLSAATGGSKGDRGVR